MIIYFSLKYALLFIFGHNKDMIGLSNAFKISNLIFLQCNFFILFLFLRNNLEMGYDRGLNQIYLKVKKKRSVYYDKVFKGLKS